MQTFPAVPAAGCFAGTAEPSTANSTLHPSGSSDADFEQHMQQSAGGHANRPERPPSTSTCATRSPVPGRSNEPKTDAAPATDPSNGSELVLDPAPAVVWLSRPAEETAGDDDGPEGATGDSVAVAGLEHTSGTVIDPSLAHSLPSPPMNVSGAMVGEGTGVDGEASNPAGEAATGVAVDDSLSEQTGSGRGASVNRLTAMPGAGRAEPSEGAEMAERHSAQPSSPNRHDSRAGGPPGRDSEATPLEGASRRLGRESESAVGRRETASAADRPMAPGGKPIQRETVPVTIGDAPVGRPTAGQQRPTGREPGLETRVAAISRFQSFAAETGGINPALPRRAVAVPFTGTSVAKMERSMDKGPETNQIAGSPEQKLPVSGGVPASREVRPLESAFDRVRDGAPDRGDRGLRLEAWTGPASLTGSSQGNAAATVTESTGAVRTAEQLLQNLTREVAQFKRINAESMAVVLKPDSQTEIFLHLATRNGQIEIQARFERGDFAGLSSQWAQLQQTLAQQGVRLSHLQENFNQSPSNGGQPEWGHGQLNQEQRRQFGGDDRPGNRHSFEETLNAGSFGEARRRPAGARALPPRSNAVLEAWA